MLTRLLPDQIAKFWDVIKYAIEECLPPIVVKNEDTMNNILASFLNDSLQCWASYRKKDAERIFEGVMVTKLIIDFASGTRSLLVYAVYAYNDTEAETWEEGIKKIAKWARRRGCSSIVAYTSDPKVVRLAEFVGGDTSQTFISIPVASFKI